MIGCGEAATGEIRLNPLPLGTLRCGDALKDLCKWNNTALTIRTTRELGTTRIKGAWRDSNRPGSAEQLSISELHAWRFSAVVYQQFKSGGARRALKRHGSLLHARILVCTEERDLRVERCNDGWPGEALLVVIRLGDTGGGASNTNAI